MPFTVLQGDEVYQWEVIQDSHLLSAINKTIPVVGILEGGTTVHLVGDKHVNMWDLSPKDLICPTKSTTEVFLSVEELDAVEAYEGCANIKECVLFLNGYNIREVNGTNLRAEAKACQVGSLVDHTQHHSSSHISNTHCCYMLLQRQAKRRKIILSGGATTMMELNKKNMDQVEAPMCQAIKKNKRGDIKCNARCAMGLLTCANHMDCCTWGDVAL